MDETKYSPPPWVINDEDPNDLKVECAAYEDETPGICGSHSKEWPLFKEDARLIAAAPDLLKALQDVVANILEYERINHLSPTPGRKYCWDSIERATAVLAKASG